MKIAGTLQQPVIPPQAVAPAAAPTDEVKEAPPVP